MRKLNIVVKENYRLVTLFKDSYGTYHAIIYREKPQDYVFCWHYDITDGTWGQGHYVETCLRAFEVAREILGALCEIQIVK